MKLITKHDCIVDASDNPQTRYLINDACVLGGKPLVSGSAMGIEGQLTVYNYNNIGPCYRCLYPKPNQKEGNKSCSENGVLGPVPGLIGVLQAIETIKVITGSGTVMSDRLLIYDSLECTFLRIKKPPKQEGCSVCGAKPTIKTISDSVDSVKFIRGPNNCLISTNSKKTTLPESLSISCREYKQSVRDADQPHILLDVRVPKQFDLCSLPGAINIPLECLAERLNELNLKSNGSIPIYCICRRGIASIAATEMIEETVLQQQRSNSNDTKFSPNTIHSVKNVTGGYNAWISEVDGSFPNY